MRSMFAAALIAVTVAAAPAGAATITLTFDTLAQFDNANLDPVASANGISFASAFLADDLDADGNPIPGETHWQKYDEPNGIYVDTPERFGRGSAPTPPLMLNGLFDQTLISFANPLQVDGFGFAVDRSSFGDPFESTIKFVDAAGKVLFESAPFLPTSAPRFDFSFAPATLAGIVLISTGKLYDDITLSTVPEPASWALMVGGMGLTGMAIRRRRHLRVVVN